MQVPCWSGPAAQLLLFSILLMVKEAFHFCVGRNALSPLSTPAFIAASAASAAARVGSSSVP